MILELRHIQSRPVISRMNSHSGCVRSFYPTLVTSTKVHALSGQHVFSPQNHRNTRLKSRFWFFFTNVPLYLRLWRLHRLSFLQFHFLSQGPSVPTALHPPERFSRLCSFIMFFLPFWQVASGTVNRETSFCKNQKPLFARAETSFFCLYQSSMLAAMLCFS